MNEAFYTGFIKRAAEHGIPKPQADMLLKQAEGFGGALKGALGGGATGAVGGGLSGGPIGAAVGGIGGALIGGYMGYKSPAQPMMNAHPQGMQPPQPGVSNPLMNAHQPGVQYGPAQSIDTTQKPWYSRTIGETPLEQLSPGMSKYKSTNMDDMRAKFQANNPPQVGAHPGMGPMATSIGGAGSGTFAPQQKPSMANI